MDLNELNELIRYCLNIKVAPPDVLPVIRRAIEAMHEPLPQRPKLVLVVDNTALR